MALAALAESIYLRFSKCLGEALVVAEPSFLATTRVAQMISPLNLDVKASKANRKEALACQAVSQWAEVACLG